MYQAVHNICTTIEVMLWDFLQSGGGIIASNGAFAVARQELGGWEKATKSTLGAAPTRAFHIVPTSEAPPIACPSNPYLPVSCLIPQRPRGVPSKVIMCCNAALKTPKLDILAYELAFEPCLIALQQDTVISTDLGL